MSLFPRQKFAAFWVLLPFLFIFAPNGVRADEPLHVHAIAGAKEYRAVESIRGFLPLLEKSHGMKTTASYGHDGIEQLDNLDQIKSCDVLLVFARRMKLREADLKLIRAHWEAGKPVVAVRTASHAFDRETNKIFDLEVLGGNYQGHFGGDAVVVAPVKGIDHPILTGVGTWQSDKLYKAGQLPPTTTVLQTGSIDDGKSSMPVTWVTTHNGGRMFYTSLGVPSDFENDDFRKMLVNAIEWVAAKE